MPTQQEIEAAYQSTLGRAPDAEGLSYWMGQSDLSGFQNAAKAELAQDVEKSYQANFGRDADTAGESYWTGMINNGAITSAAGLNAAIKAGAQGDDVSAMADKASYPTSWNSSLNPDKPLYYDATADKWTTQQKKVASTIPYVTAPTTVKADQTYRVVNPTTETVQGQIQSIIAANSPVLQQARASAMQSANDRGLINSSIAQNAAESAVLDKAITIGTADANVYGNAANLNTNTANTISQNYANAQNTASLTAMQVNADLAKANLSAQTQLDISGIESNYKTLVQANASAGNLYQQALQNITNIVNNNSMDAANKQAAIDQQVNMLKSGLSMFSSINSLDLTSMLKFSTSSPTTTTTTSTSGAGSTTTTTDYSGGN